MVLIIDVVHANEFLQDEIGIRTSPDPSDSCAANQ